MDGEDERTRQLAGRDDGVEVGQESASHFSTRQILACQAETANRVASNGIFFGRVVSHSSVLEEDDLSSLTSISEPRLVGDSFVFGYAVPFGKRDDSPASRRRVGTWIRPRLRSRKRSGSPAGCGTEDVLNLRDWHAELCREGVDVVAGPESLKHVVQ